VIELASAGVLMWRLSVELHYGQRFSENAERIATRVGGALLFLLAAYVTVAAVWHLWNGSGEQFSWSGFAVALVAIPAMRYLAQRKITIARSRLIPKQTPKARRRQLGVADGMLDRLVAQIALDGARIDAVIRQFVAAAMPQHMRVNFHVEACRASGTFHHGHWPQGQQIKQQCAPNAPRVY
jgi:hypothetical protein